MYIVTRIQKTKNPAYCVAHAFDEKYGSAARGLCKASDLAVGDKCNVRSYPRKEGGFTTYVFPASE